MIRAPHKNSGKCERCIQIRDRYPGYHTGLWDWFSKLQSNHPEAHISCFGRGVDEQELLLMRKATRAKYGGSAHNFNCALDLFVMLPNVREIYPPAWFNNVLAHKIPPELQWYGETGSMFYELPHVEVRNWRLLRAENKLKLVEEFHVEQTKLV